MKLNKIVWILAVQNQRVECRLYSLIKICMTHIPVIHKKELLGSGFSCRFGLTYKAGYLSQRSIYINRDKLLIEVLAYNINDTLP